MKKIIVIAALVAGLGSFGSAMAAGDAAAGKVKAAVCAACHGANGISVNAMWPNLAGQKADYIIKQLKAFKAGTRKDPLMSPQAAQLSDQDMENLAAHFSSLK
ncbi:MAG TPA: cytochrome c [Thiolapillus brandeum]|uniref:Cytochrome c n=1 Tax=Thiolapillus brandeum TaxID=1076588 RepID=A0A831WB74_9GAMM|nr:cytochrome c [Thiolapillus brandeum]